MNSTRRVLVLGAGSLLLVGLAGMARAAGPPKVGIMRFTGPGETDFRVLSTKILGARGFELVGARALEETAEENGLQLSSKEGTKVVGAALGLAAIIDGRIEIEQGVATARIAVRDPRDGSIAANELWTVRKGGARALAKLMIRTFWKRLGPTIEEVTGHEGRAPVVARHARRRHR
jgi:hypothetical protein